MLLGATMSDDLRFVIFLVDDDEGVLRALNTMLVTMGFEVQTFSSATDFLNRHDRSIPGCAILDVSMPDLDGIELQRALKERGTDRPVIFVTGVGDIPTSVQAMKAGAVDFLTKPVKAGHRLRQLPRPRQGKHKPCLRGQNCRHQQATCDIDSA